MSDFENIPKAGDIESLKRSVEWRLRNGRHHLPSHAIGEIMASIVPPTWEALSAIILDMTRPDEGEHFYLDWEGAYHELKRQMALPPAGWFTLGTHAGQEGLLEFWGSEGGVPIWERPVVQVEVDRFKSIVVCANCRMPATLDYVNLTNECPRCHECPFRELEERS